MEDSTSHKNSDLPLVSIVTPSFQQAEFIEETILSVKNQRYPNIEHVIMDGGSTDGTVEVLKRYEGSYRMSWVSEPDDGQSDAINKGFARTTGQIVAWLNSDDVYYNERVIEDVVKEFADTGADVIYGNDALIGQHGEILRIRIFPKFSYGRLLRYGGISQPAVFFRRSVVERHQLRTDLAYAMDTEFWLRLGKTHRFRHLNRVLAGNRIHAQRKQIAHRGEVDSTRLAVSKEYGLRWRRWTALQTLLLDRPLTAILRFWGLWDLWRSRSPSQCSFPFIHPPSRFASALKAQLLDKL